MGASLDDDDVVDVAFPQSRRRDPDELRLRVKLFDGAATGVTHARPEAADELVDARLERPPEGNPPLDPLGNQLQAAFDVVLHIAVAASRLHGLERPHPPVHLVASPLKQDGLPGTLLRPREEAPDHDGVGARGQGLGDITGELDAAVGYDRCPVSRG